jgi:hypothetical protein
MLRGGENMGTIPPINSSSQNASTTRTPQQQVQIFVMQINLRPKENKREVLDKLVGYIKGLKIDPASRADKSLTQQISAKLEEIQDPVLKQEAFDALAEKMK